MSSSIVIQIQPQNDSGEQGTASLTPMGDSSTKVSISLTGGPSDVAQPAHIHSGSCANLDPKPEYPLQSVTNGHSTTVVPVSLQKLLSSADAINVHKSASEISTYVACGDIVKANAMREIPGVALVDYF
ncbi:MAG: hypothetical protein KGM44_13950 [bacterium]|nr:hypothetical protein [bacterium]